MSHPTDSWMDFSLCGVGRLGFCHSYSGDFLVSRTVEHSPQTEIEKNELRRFFQS